MWRSNRVFSNAKPLEPDDTPSRGRPIALEELPALRPYARVNFVAGVQDLGDIHTTQSGANVQRITIRDSSGTATLNAWGKHVDALSVGKFYQFSNMMVKEFGGANTLTTPKHGASIEPTADVDGIEIAPVSWRAPVTVADAAVRSVTDFTSKLMCPARSHGHLVVSMEEPGMGTCSACPTKAKLSKCKRRRVTAILHVDVDDTLTLQLTADGPVLMKIAEVDDQTKITQFNIINSSSFSLIYNEQTSVSFPMTISMMHHFFKMYFRLLSTCRVRGSRQCLRHFAHPVSLPPRENPSPPLPSRTNPTQPTPPLPPPKNPTPPPPRLRKWRTARVGCRTKAKKNARLRPTTIRARRCAQK